MWRHRCASGLKEKLYLRSGSQRHIHLAGFFNVPVQHRHRTNLFIRWFRHTAPLVAFYDTLGIRKTYSRLKPPAPSRGRNALKHVYFIVESRRDFGASRRTVYHCQCQNGIGQPIRVVTYLQKICLYADMQRLVPLMNVLFWGRCDFPISFSGRDMSRNVWNRL